MRMAVVVDTNVLSYLFKGDTRAAMYRPHLEGQRLFLSFMTIAELDRWALGHKWGQARIRQLGHYLARHYAVRHSDRALCSHWAEVTHTARSKGRPIAPADAWIAATAQAMGIPLVTHNPAHFAAVDGLTLLTAVGK